MTKNIFTRFSLYRVEIYPKNCYYKLKILKGIVMNLEIKEITNFFEDGKNKTRLVFNDKNKEREIVFEGNGKLKMPVAEA